MEIRDSGLAFHNYVFAQVWRISVLFAFGCFLVVTLFGQGTASSSGSTRGTGPLRVTIMLVSKNVTRDESRRSIYNDYWPVWADTFAKLLLHTRLFPSLLCSALLSLSQCALFSFFFSCRAGNL
jgi:hypothetical protein